MCQLTAGTVRIGGSSTSMMLTVSVKTCTAAPREFVAVIVTETGDPAVVVGVPLRTPVVGLSVTPAGKEPTKENVGTGNPFALTVNVPGWP